MKDKTRLLALIIIMSTILIVSHLLLSAINKDNKLKVINNCINKNPGKSEICHNIN